MVLGDGRRRRREEENERGSEEPSAVPQFSPLDLISIPLPGSGEVGVAQKIKIFSPANRVRVTPRACGSGIQVRLKAQGRKDLMQMFYIWGPTARYE